MPRHNEAKHNYLTRYAWIMQASNGMINHLGNTPFDNSTSMDVTLQVLLAYKGSHSFYTAFDPQRVDPCQ